MPKSNAVLTAVLSLASAFVFSACTSHDNLTGGTETSNGVVVAFSNDTLSVSSIQECKVLLYDAVYRDILIMPGWLTQRLLTVR